MGFLIANSRIRQAYLPDKGSSRGIQGLPRGRALTVYHKVQPGAQMTGSLHVNKTQRGIEGQGWLQVSLPLKPS